MSVAMRSSILALAVYPAVAGTCCWSKWGDDSTCGNYPSGGSGGICGNDGVTACSTDTDCANTPSPTPQPTPSPTPVPPVPTPTPSPTPSGSGCVQVSGHQWCSARAVASAWIARSGAPGDCAAAMAIAFGEGINNKYIMGDGIHFDTFDFDSTDAFNVDQTPYDGQATLGPWQVLTKKTVGTIEDRVDDAVDYLNTCCGQAGNCGGWAHIVADCANVKDGACHNPNGNDASFPLTTIFASTASPPLPWCGCAATGSPTIGFSGRCSNHRTDDYERYLSGGQQACSQAQGLGNTSAIIV